VPTFGQLPRRDATCGAAAGIKAFIPLSDNFSITPRILYEGRNGTFTANPENYPILGQANKVENLLLTKQFKASIATIGADLFVAYYLTDNGLYLAGGPSIATIVSKRFVQTEHIESPGGVTYLGGAPDATVLDSDLDITKSLQVLVKLGAGYQIHLSEKFTLNPEAMYGLALTKFSNTYDWSGSALQLTLGLLYSF
ncbi:MAG: outer membrane beta-barrel protein, partial [Ignavibacteriota bacterium]